MSPVQHRFLGMLKNTGEEGLPQEEGESSFFVPTQPGELPGPSVTKEPPPQAWAQRAAAIGAGPLAVPLGLMQLRKVWLRDAMMATLGAKTIEHMVPFMQFHTVPAEQELILQDELGDFMLVVLRGTVSVVRKQETEVLVLAQVAPGDMLGEMSLLDGGERFSTCITRTECDIGVLTADGLARMVLGAPRIAAKLMALLARKLSMRLRVVSARLGGRKA